MVAVLEAPRARASIRVLPAPASASGGAAQAIAHGYLRYAVALWSGEAIGRSFGAWLDRFRCTEMPPVPPGSPDAVSPHGAGGRGIRWYETSTAVLGYIPGGGFGFLVPTREVGAA